MTRMWWRKLQIISPPQTNNGRHEELLYQFPIESLKLQVLIAAKQSSFD